MCGTHIKKDFGSKKDLKKDLSGGLSSAEVFFMLKVNGA
jgi:hypothetical protein